MKVLKGLLSVVLMVACIYLPSVMVSAATYKEFEYEVTGSGATITAYKGTADQVDVPSNINGNAVTKIGSKAFFGNTKIRKIILPKGITHIEEYAFSGCKNLRTMQLPSTLTNIGEGVLTGSTSISSVIIPESVTTISNGAFASVSDMFKLEVYNGTVGQHYAITYGVKNTVIDNNKTYTVKFEGVPQTVIYGKAAIPPTNPIKSGYTFTGWDKEFDMVTSNLDVKAKWSSLSYTVSFEANGGGVVDSIELPHGTGVAALPAPIRNGYVFDGWYLDKSLTTRFDTVVANHTLYAKWIKSATVTFIDGSRIVKSEPVTSGGKAVAFTPVKEGYEFMGWYTTDKLTTKYSFKNIVTSNLKLYARWARIYTINFKDGVRTLSSQEIAAGSYVIKYTPTKLGYSFKGWFTDSALKTKYNFDTKVTKAINLYAGWTKKAISASTVEEISNEYLNSCVRIQTYDKERRPLANGSGFIVNDGPYNYIATNYHVISQSYYVTAELENGKVIELDKISAYSKEYDFAVLSPKVSLTGVKPVVLGDSVTVSIGGKCITIGSPSGLKNTVSQGLISQSRTINGVENFQISTPISYGSSGGALFNMNGEVVGMTTSGYAGVSADLNFAIIIDYLKRGMKNLVDQSIFDVSGYTTAEKYDTLAGTLIPIPSEGVFSHYVYDTKLSYVEFNYKSIDIQKYIAQIEGYGFRFVSKYEIDSGEQIYEYATSYGYSILFGVYKGVFTLAGDVLYPKELVSSEFE